MMNIVDNMYSLLTTILEALYTVTTERRPL